MTQLDLLGGSSFVPNPKWIASKMAVVNIKKLTIDAFSIQFLHSHMYIKTILNVYQNTAII